MKANRIHSGRRSVGLVRNGLVALFLLASLSPAARAEVKAKIIIDEFGNGTLTYNDVNAPVGLRGTTVALSAETHPYTSPACLNAGCSPSCSAETFPNALFYVIPDGFNVTDGDLLIQKHAGTCGPPATAADTCAVIRFLQPDEWVDPQNRNVHAIVFFPSSGPLPCNAGQYPPPGTPFKTTHTACTSLGAGSKAVYQATGDAPNQPGATEINQGTVVNYEVSTTCPSIAVTKLIACRPPGPGECDKLNMDAYGHSATGVVTATQSPAFCYSITVSNPSTVALDNIIVTDDKLDLSGCFPTTAPNTFSLAPGAWSNCFVSASINTLTTNTVTATSGTLIDSNQAVAVVLPASISCVKHVSSADDQDGNPNDNHVTLVDNGLAHLVTYSFSITAGSLDLVNVNVNDHGLCPYTDFSLAAGTTTNLLPVCPELLLCGLDGNAPVVNTVTVTADVDTSKQPFCTLDNQGQPIKLTSMCQASVDCAPCAVVLGLVKTDVSCNGGSDGSVIATFAGGTGPYTISIDGGAFVAATSPKTFSSLAAGAHSVTVKDANNCANTQSATVGQPTVVNLSLVKTDVSCNGGSDGSVIATFSGGTGPYTISIDGGAFVAATSPKTFSSLAAGAHSVTVKDANNCANTQSATVGQPTVVNLSLVKTDVSCNGGSDGSVIATFAGGTGPYTISIDGGAFVAATSPKTFSGLAAGAHSVTVKDANNCANTQSATVGQPTVVNLSLVKTDVSCNGGSDGSVIATFAGGTGPYTISIDGGAFVAATAPKTFSGLAAGAHSVTVKDANNCANTQSATVGQPTVVNLSLVKTDVSCNGGSDGSVIATFAGGTGPYTISLDGGAFVAATSPKTFSSLAAGAHSVTVKDANNCANTQSATVGQPTVVNLSLVKTDVSCNGGSDGSVIATFSGGTGPYTISIDGGAFVAATSPKTFSGLAAGAHSVTVKDANNCANTQSATVGQPTVVNLSLVKTDVSCNGGSDGSVIATFSGGTAPYTIALDGGAFAPATSPKTFSGLTAGPHSVTVKDANNCPATLAITVNQPAAVSLGLTKTDVSCNGGSDGSVTATFSGGTAPYTIALDGGAFAPATSPKTFSGLTAGSHSVTVKDANNCPATLAITVNQPAAVSLGLTKTDVSCNGGSDGSVTATFSGGTAPYTIALDGGAFAPATSPKTFPGLTAGSHSVTVKDANNCPATLAITVNQPAAVSLGLTKTDASCNANDGSVTATFSGGTAPYTIALDGGAFAPATSPKTFPGLTAGSHSVTVKDANSCSATLAITINQTPPNGQIGDFVWNDLNGNGCQDAGEPGLAGVKVDLYRGTCGGTRTFITTTTTDGGGHYLFDNLCPGDYQVAITTPVGFAATKAKQACTINGPDPSNNQTDSKCDCAGGSPCFICVTLTPASPVNLNVDCGYVCATVCVPFTMSFEGNSALSGTAGNVRTFTVNGVSVKATAWSRLKTSATWATAYLGSYAGGLGVTDSSEGDGSSNRHTVDNIDRNNYVLFEFSQPVVLNQAYLGYVVNDSDLNVWIGTFADPYNNHLTLSDAVLASFGYSETNLTTLTTTRWADLNAGNVIGNAIIIAADVGDTTPEDMFKIAKFDLCQRQCMPLTLTCATSAGQVGVAYASAVVVSGGTAPYTFVISSGSLPPGLTLNPSTGAITGSPTTAGTYNYTVKVTDSTGATAFSSGCAITITNPCTGSICGSVLRDCDANGNLSGEAGLSGWTVTLKNSSGNAVATTTTGSSGSYCFNGLAAGTYTVVVTPPTNYVLTTPAGCNHRQSITLSACQNKTGINFGYRGNAPGVSLTKTAVKTSSNVITYTFTVKNTGNTCFYGGMHVDDPMLGGQIWYKTPVSPGESYTFTKTYTIPSRCPTYISNTATATGHPPTGSAVTATATATIHK